MSNYKAVLFDLDDTLLNRNKAIDKMFSIVLDKCYENAEFSAKHEMLFKFWEYDKRSYGDSDKVKVIVSFFDEFPPIFRLQHSIIQEFWNDNFPLCFSISQNTLDIINTIKKYAKIAIITNGSIQRQKAKINNTNLNSYFDTIIISEEVGFCKPDKRIFELALKKLSVQPEEALFVGDDIEKDIGGCQNSNIKGIWFNPYRNKNDTEIKPYAEINSLDKLLGCLKVLDNFSFNDIT